MVIHMGRKLIGYPSRPIWIHRIRLLFYISAYLFERVIILNDDVMMT